MAAGADLGRSRASKQVRWSTIQRAARSGSVAALQDAFSGKNGASEKKRVSGGSSSTSQEGENGDGGPSARRKVYFNQPLPDDAKDEHGLPTVNFELNKIRTAKYTPLTFVPKNLWYQFHNIANVYFLFLIILGVRLP